MDGVRIISNTTCEFLQRVPEDLGKSSSLYLSLYPHLVLTSFSPHPHNPHLIVITVNVFQAGSVHEAAMLTDAYEELYERKSAKADEKLRAIEEDLEPAVNTCITAATGKRPSPHPLLVLRILTSSSPILIILTSSSPHLPLFLTPSS